jgi:hypothetical protein
MQYSKYQRFTSFFILFFFLFSTTFRIPLDQIDVYAENNSTTNIVSIIVEEEAYNSLKWSIATYSKNISSVLNNTQVVILPTPKNTTAYEIASLNESLYLEWFKTLNDWSHNAQLVGTLIVWDLSLPIAYENNNAQKTIVPFVDFKDKYFRYNHENGKYEKNDKNLNGLWVEIWHWVVSPNLGSEWENIQAMDDFFWKTDSFYNGTWLFAETKWVLNGNPDDSIPENYEPYVFYFDQIRESKAASLDSFRAYEAYLENKEDILYQRYNQKLWDKIKEKVLDAQKDSMEGLQDILWDSINLSTASWPELLNVPDIQIRHIINKSTKKFVEIFSKWSIGELRKNVNNAWRYNYSWNKVNADFIPYLITILDSVNDEIIKEANDDFELQIDQKVDTELQNDIYIPYKVEQRKSKYSRSYTDVYINLLSGKNPADIINAEECTPYRGSSYSSGSITLWNRGLVMSNIESDIQLLKSIDDSMSSTLKICMNNIQNWISSSNIFWWNTPLNIDTDNAGEWIIALNTFNTNNSLVPVFDISGSYIPKSLPYNSTNYQQCLNNNFYAYTLHDVDDIFSSPEVDYQLPALWLLPNKNEWSCLDIPKKAWFNDTFKSLQANGNCSGLTCTINNTTYYFKKISSVVSHKEPIDETIRKQIKSGITPSLPIDKDRFIDFQNINWDYEKINYPYLFRFSLPKWEDYNFENFDKFFKIYLEDNKEEFWWVDFYTYLKDKEDKVLKIWEDEKILSYYDSLVFALYWNNLNSVSGKYKFVFQNYLNDQFAWSEKVSNSTESKKFNYPKNKKQYEIAYLGAHWDTENMYVQMNPESKWENPYKDIIKKNANLQSELLGLNIGAWKSDTNNNENIFKCAPPEGVPIYEWIPAVVCWLDDMLPPTITVTESTCGPTIPLLNQEEKDYLAQCNWDVNKNAINDCLENKLIWWSIDMSSDGNRYYYNKPWKLTVRILDASDNVLTFNNSTNVEFELLRIEAIKDEKKEFTAWNKKVVYSLWDDKINANKYINFTSNSLRPQWWVVESFFTTKWVDANYIFQAKLEVLNNNDEKEIELISNQVTVEVRGDRLFSTLHSLIIDEDSGEITSEVWINDIIVSDKSQIFILDSNEQKLKDVQKNIYSKNNVTQKAIISLDNISKWWASLRLIYPLTLELIDDNDEVIVDEITITKSQLSNFYSFPGITKTWTFTLKITDGNGFVSKKELNLISEEADHFKLHMWASVMESNWAVTSNVISILDKFDNIIIGRPYTLDVEIKGESIVFEHNKEKKSSNPVVEWYKIFRLLSEDTIGNNKIQFSLKDFTWNTILSDETDVKVVEEININIVENNNIKVWGDTYELNIQIVDENNNVYSDINSRLYFSMNSIYGKTIKPYFDVINWVAKIELITTTLAAKNVPIEIQVEWLRTIYEKNIKILHDEPEYIQLWMNQYAIEALEWNISDIEVFVKDKYGNITFENNNWTASLEVLSEYEKYVTINEWNSGINQWVATLSVAATDLPWMAYFKVSVNDLDAVGKIETYFYWNNKTIKETSYNALYTTLLGAPYGDITKENYLAWSLLFDKNNRSLAVTSLLNNPFSRNDVVMIEHNWGVSSIAESTDLSTDIEFSTSIENKKLIISVKNKALWNYIWKVAPILWEETELNMCHGNNWDFAHCNISDEKSSIVLQSDWTDYKGYGDSESLYIQDQYWRKIFSINKEGSIERDGKIYFELDENNEKKYLKIKIFSWNKKIGDLIYNLVWADIKTSRSEELFNKTKNVVKNTILLLLWGDRYSAAESYSEGNNNKVIYYNNPLDIDNQLDNFSKWNLFAYENFVEKGGNGWSEWNKSLLQFASWESVWESVKAYQSFGVINLWDPVLRLKKIQQSHAKLPWKLKDFDSTIWKILSNKTSVESYEFLDYNNNGKQDIILIHWDKYIELLENTDNEKNYRSIWNLAHIYDLWGFKNIKTWDFTWDWFDDIFFVNKQWDPYLLNNNNKDYFRIDLRKQFNLSGRILQAEAFDMDKDGKQDIVLLDDSGNISIMYGWGTSKIPVFKNDALWLLSVPTAQLNSTPRTDRGAIYYKGLVSLWKAWDNSDLMRDSEAFMNAIQENVENLSDFNWTWVNTTLLDWMVFVQIPYKYNELTLPASQLLVDWINSPLSTEVGAWVIDSRVSLDNFIATQTEWITYPETFPEWTESDFIRSEYSETVDINIEKIYSWDLKKWSIVNFELTITNNSNEKIEEIAYVEDIITIFTLDETSIDMSKNAQIRYDIPWYNFLIDDFNLVPGESFTLKAKLTTAPIKLGFIKVGLFEEGESWNDIYWDIIYSNSQENCSETVDIYRSLWIRKYGFWNKVPVCDSELPPEIKQNAEDSDNNGIPDYIDKIINWSASDLQEYASWALEDIYQDTDGDGIPDMEDNTSSDKDFLSNLDEINENVDHIMSWIDNLVQWLSCGFGWWGCIATPLNWAPLAPGWDPTLFGSPIWDGLNVDEWIPIFSAFTWMQYGPVCWPAIWPVSWLGPWCTGKEAWGSLWINSSSNFFRLFVTPTLTWGMWVAACFGWPASVAGYANMPWLSPLLPGWNCIVTAMPLASCSSDGSDWDASTLWSSSTSSSAWGGWVSIINANCTWDKQQVNELDLDLVQEYFDYKTTWNKSQKFEDLFKESFSKIAHPDNANISDRLNEPLITINGQWMDNELSLNIDFWAGKSGSFSDIIQIKNRRISWFPDFLMWWVTRQIEEIVTKLTDFPTVFIILPDFSGVLDFWEKSEEDIEDEGYQDLIQANDNLNAINENETVKSVNSGIKTAYTFMSNIPLIELQQENLSIEIPWVDWNEVNATLEKWWQTSDQWKAELKRAKEAWSLWGGCSYTDTKEQKECEENNAASEKITLQMEWLINSLEQNMEAIKSYKEFPKKLNKLVQKKEDYLEQILCNVEIISEILWGWIGSNWERFKAWVELYILIKAILKSWQLLIDVFVDYEAECSECKNERWDLMEFIWKMISAVIPSIPVIQFPKWPDIIMDLHNIRAGLVITLPEFTFGTRPILLPTLPNLYLPDVPTISINLPEIPVLPTIDIPELPDLPGLPTVELPNLPPPPTLPKMFASLEGILEILKAITKAMCILKTSPFVPEWRAWDQIAFLTERSWYLPTDFIDLSLPQFSYPFVDAIKVTTYVNLEFETDFITELARQVTMPLTTFSNDFTQILNLWVDDLDFSQLPSHIDINIWTDWVEWQIWHTQEERVLWFAIYIVRGVNELVQHLDNGKNNTVSNSDFKKLVAESLASDVFVWHPKYNSFRSVWDPVFNYSFAKEDKFISDLKQNNFDKFDTLKNILHTEILKNKEFGKNIETYLQPQYIQKVDIELNNDVDAYNNQLAVYNNRFKKSALALVNGGWSPMQNDLENRGERLLEKVWSPLLAYTQGDNSMNMATTSTSHVPAWNSCEVASKSQYRYQYKGLYVEMAPKITYRLFDYLNELDWKEEIKSVDVDNDWDSDVVYLMNGQIFIKENLKNQLWRGWAEAIIIESDDNIFYNSKEFISAVDNFREWSIDNNTINADFSSVTRWDVFNYRLEFNRLIDKTTKKKSIVDSFSQITETVFEKEDELFIFSKNLAYINKLWILKDLQLITKELINIKDDLQNDNIVDISAWTKIYGWKTPLRLSYILEWSTDIRILIIDKHKNIELKSSIKVVWISWDAYVEWRYDITLKWENIRTYLGKPIFPDAHFEYIGNPLSMDPMTYAEIKYYDETEALLNFNFIEEYYLYDLGRKSENYSITLNMKNDYIYATIRSFKEKIFSTYSKQIVLSPQFEADNIAPSLFLSEIKIPVYQEKDIDLSDSIFDDGKLAWIKYIGIDMNLEEDSDLDGNTKNDNDIALEKITLTSNKIWVKFWIYDSLMKKNIWFTLRDKNDNQSFTEVWFEVYAPIPEIQSIKESTLIWLLDEDLDEEPVSLYRYRWGVISKLKDSSGGNKTWTDSWWYDFEMDQNNEWLTLDYAGNTIATIAESTGKITLKDFTAMIKVLPSNNFQNKDLYPKIEIVKDNSAIYYQYLKVSDVDNIESVIDFNNILDTGIYVNFTDTEKYGFYSIPETVSYNPWTFVIYRTGDINKEPLFVLYPDGRIDTLNEFYTLDYSSYNDFIVLKLIDKHFNKEIAQVLFHIDGWYIMK